MQSKRDIEFKSNRPMFFNKSKGTTPADLPPKEEPVHSQAKEKSSFNAQAKPFQPSGY